MKIFLLLALCLGLVSSMSLGHSREEVKEELMRILEELQEKERADLNADEEELEKKAEERANLENAGEEELKRDDLNEFLQKEADEKREQAARNEILQRADEERREQAEEEERADTDEQETEEKKAENEDLEAEVEQQAEEKRTQAKEEERADIDEQDTEEKKAENEDLHEKKEAKEKRAQVLSSCTRGPLGMESGAIPDNSITASSSASASYPPRNARLNVGTTSSGWRPSTPANQWIQVDLGEKSHIAGVIVGGYKNYVVLTFTVQYSDTGLSDDWQSLADAQGEIIQLTGNDKSATPVTVVFPDVLNARYLRISPATWSSTAYRLKFEVLGCQDIQGMLRLVDGDGIRSGRVEIFHNGAWGAVYDRDWDIQDATTVCRQFGFLQALKATTGSSFGESDLPAVMDRVACEGTENRLDDCPFVCTSSQQHNHSHEAGVICNIIRLVGSAVHASGNHISGRVEIYRDGHWGTICDNDWDINDAEVVCHQLGFPGAKEAKSGAFFGPGEGAIHMDKVKCSGSESKITDCPSHCWEQTIKCQHNEDAGVICRDGEDND